MKPHTLKRSKMSTAQGQREASNLLKRLSSWFPQTREVILRHLAIDSIIENLNKTSSKTCDEQGCIKGFCA